MKKSTPYQRMSKSRFLAHDEKFSFEAFYILTGNSYLFYLINNVNGRHEYGKTIKDA